MPYDGGLCKFWFIPREEILHIPNISPVDQYLITEITLLPGKVWRGPVPVPENEKGLTVTQEISKAGHFYKIKLLCNLPGDLPESDVNLENMPYHEYVIVGKQRAGGFYKVIGNKDEGAFFDQEFNTGGGAPTAANAGSKLAFTQEQFYRPLILREFSGDQSNYIFPPNFGGAGTTNDFEIIFINNEANKAVSWTPARQAKFGMFPIVETWLRDATGTYYLAAVQPFIDAPPPGMTLMSFDFGGNVTGFIIIK